MAHTIETKLASASGARAKSLRALGNVRRAVVKYLSHIVIWQERVEQRSRLAELNDHMLKDIGVSKADAYKEVRKPFWLP